ncbi:MAG: PQQ-binding-like beta-propeller repeat protein [Halioglobus sp.]
MKKLFAWLLLALVLATVVVGVSLLLMDAPGKALEALVIRHADKLPLAYFGERLFDKHCASCHDNPAMHAPTREALAGFSKESILVALEFGKMQPMAAHLRQQERFLIATYLAGGGQDTQEWIAQHRCTAQDSSAATQYVTDWGLGTHNRRFADNDSAGINRQNVASLQLVWALGFPKVTDMRSQPAIVGDTLYFGDKTGNLYALDRTSGCVRAHTKVFSGIRSAMTVANLPDGQQLLVFADSLATVFAVDPQSFEIVWQHSARLFDTSVITGSISYYDNRLFVPISSFEVAAAGSPSHICCKSHGGVIALQADSGEPLWQWHATEAATLQGHNTVGQEQYGPSGASVWTTPAIDAKRNRLYIGTGENLTHPATDTSDAIIALDMDSGAMVWKFQPTAGDVWNAACLNNGANCPTNPGGDFDFGASVIITQRQDGSALLLAGQKSGEVFALDPDPQGKAGEVLWRQRVSLGTTNGGIHWGMAVAGQRLIVPVADPERDRPGYTPKPGLYALDVNSGNLLWQHKVERGCEIAEENKPLIGLENLRSAVKPDLAQLYLCSFFYGLSAAALATPEIAFSAGLDGKLRAYDITNGEILWQVRTAEPFDAGNGIKAHGGAIDVGGQVVAGGWLYVQSGYSMFGQLPGNVLLAYRVSQDQPAAASP